MYKIDKRLHFLLCKVKEECKKVKNLSDYELKNKTNVFEVTLPEGKDPADCTKEELLTAYLSKKKCN